MLNFNLIKRLASIIVTTIILCSTPLVFASDDLEISDLQWMDEGYLTRQRSIIENITKFEYGAPLRRNKSDLRSISRIIEAGLINQTETQKQHALGVALGDIFVTELNMQWRVYEDNDGKSLAVCMLKTTHCLFPVTMLAKRMRLGVKPDINKMYDRGVELMKPYIPRVPYSSKKI